MSPAVRSFDNLGIPDAHSEAFLAAADTTGCVILTRTPGLASKMLLEDGYDGKCFHIKGKSCDWGPMAGFVCLDPILNKEGIKGGLSNLLEHHKSLTMGYEGRVASFMQIIISDVRIRWLVHKGYIDPVDLRAPMVSGIVMARRHAGVPNDIELIIPGIPWLLLPSPPQGWALFYDRSQAYNMRHRLPDNLRNSRQGMELLLQAFEELFFSAQRERDRVRIIHPRRIWQGYPEGENAFRHIHQLISRTRGFIFQNVTYEPVLGLVNPHPPYAARLNYKNAVTGDYDLFGVWPPTGGSRMKDVRPVRMRPHIDGREIVRGEDPAVGNISDRVFLVAQLINSEIARRTRESVIPNRVFHSDEAGRPFVSDCNLPVAVFLPRGPGDRMIRIANKDELRQFVVHHQRHYRLYINPACVDKLDLPRHIFSWD